MDGNSVGVVVVFPSAHASRRPLSQMKLKLQSRRIPGNTCSSSGGGGGRRRHQTAMSKLHSICGARISSKGRRGRETKKKKKKKSVSSEA